jgi:hypothetical protein
MNTAQAQTSAVRFLSSLVRAAVSATKVGMAPMGLTTETKPADSCKYSFQFGMKFIFVEIRSIWIMLFCKTSA